MNILDVQPKDIHVVLELSIEEIARILDFYDLANPLYVKVMKDSDMKTGEYMAEVFIANLREVFDDIRKGVKHGS